MGALVAPTPTRKLLRRSISIIIAMIDIVLAAWSLVTRPAWLGSWSAARRRGVGSGLPKWFRAQSFDEVEGRRSKRRLMLMDAPKKQIADTTYIADPRAIAHNNITIPCGGSL